MNRTPRYSVLVRVRVREIPRVVLLWHIGFRGPATRRRVRTVKVMIFVYDDHSGRSLVITLNTAACSEV